MPAVTHIGHINLRATEPLIAQLRAFYVDIIGLEEGPRPRLRSGSPGYWLYAGEYDVVHLSMDASIQLDPTTPPTTAFNHVAFACLGLNDTLDRLRAAGIDYQINHIDDLQQVQLFLTDPAGIGIELNFTGESLPG